MTEVSPNPSTTNEHEEPEQAAIREHLDLRPIYYTDNRSKGCHPDQPPCPSWCWVADSDEYDHEVDPHDPMQATHTMDGMVAIAASQYAGVRYRGDDDAVETATIKFHVEQRGQDAPVIVVALRSEDLVDDTAPYGNLRRLGYQQLLRLSLTDAEELATVLQYVVKRAEG